MTPAFYTVDQVAATLQVSPRTVQRMLDAQTLPWVYVGRQRRVPVPAFDAWVAARTTEALSAQRQEEATLIHARFHRPA